MILFYLQAPQGKEECAEKIKACNGNLECVLRVMKECGKIFLDQLFHILNFLYFNIIKLYILFQLYPGTFIFQPLNAMNKEIVTIDALDKKNNKSKSLRRDLNDSNRLVQSISNQSNKNLQGHCYSF